MERPIVYESRRYGPWVFVGWRLHEDDRLRVLALLCGPLLARRARFALWWHAKIARW